VHASIRSATDNISFGGDQEVQRGLDADFIPLRMIATLDAEERDNPPASARRPLGGGKLPGHQRDQRDLKDFYGMTRRESEAETGWFLSIMHYQGFASVYEE
jgi:hypothetical protein